MSRRSWLWVLAGAVGCLLVFLIIAESGTSQRRSLMGTWTYYSGSLFDHGQPMKQDEVDANKMGTFTFSQDGSFVGTNARSRTQGNYTVGTDTVTLQYTEASVGKVGTLTMKPRRVGAPNVFDIDWKSDKMVELSEEHPPGQPDVIITLKR